MKKISKIILALFLISLILTIATPTLAIDPPDDPGGVPTGLIDAISKISSAILFVIATVAVLFLIIGGFQYITSAGNPDAIEKAKNTILYAVIGILASLLAYAVVQFIISQIK